MSAVVIKREAYFCLDKWFYEYSKATSAFIADEVAFFRGGRIFYSSCVSITEHFLLSHRLQTSNVMKLILKCDL